VAGKVNGFSLAYTAVGAVVLWSGIKGWSISSTFQNLLKGTTPASTTETIDTTSVEETSAASTGTAGSNPSGSSGGSASVNQGIAKMLAIANCHPTWVVDPDWSDWVDLWNQESGWNQNATNPSSGAYGIAQALGHGTAGSAGSHDEYGASYGLTTAEAVAANNGNASDQILWGIGYIGATYGSPSAAWAHETANGWY